MHIEFQKSFEKLEKRKSSILKRLESVEDEYLHFKPTPESWSLVQVIGHLNDAEQASLAYCGKKIQAGSELPKSSIFSSARLIILNIFLKSKIRYKAPKEMKQPSNVLVFHNLCMTWFNTRKSLRRFLESVPEELVNRGVYKHPFMGRFTLNEMLLFFYAHLKHHEYQINRLIKKIDTLDTDQ